MLYVIMNQLFLEVSLKSSNYEGASLIMKVLIYLTFSLAFSVFSCLLVTNYMLTPVNQIPRF